MTRPPTTSSKSTAGASEPGTATDFSRLEASLVGELHRQLAQPLAAGLYLVATPIGNLGDLTVRAVATLARADLICCEDTRHSRTLLAHYGIGRPLRPLHEHNEESEVPRLLESLAAGQAIALVSDAGTPLVSDPGYRLVRAAVGAGHRVTALPGPSAALAALTVSGLPCDRFEFAGFLPPRQAARRTRLAELASTQATLILYEAPGRVGATLGDVAEVMGDRPIVVARELTKRFEEVRRGSARELADAFANVEQKGEFVLLIGPSPPLEVTEALIEARLREALATESLRDAARTVAEALGVPRSRAYEIGLRLKDET